MYIVLPKIQLSVFLIFIFNWRYTQGTAVSFIFYVIFIVLSSSKYSTQCFFPYILSLTWKPAAVIVIDGMLEEGSTWCWEDETNNITSVLTLEYGNT